MQVSDFVGGLEVYGFSLGVEIYLVNVCSLCPKNVGVGVVANHQAVACIGLELLQGMVKYPRVRFFVTRSLRGDYQFKIVGDAGGPHFFRLRLIEAIGDYVESVRLLEVF